MLTRASVRAREMSVRVALGARRMRLVRQLLTESLLLALVGGGMGLLVAFWGSRALLRLASAGPDPIPLDAGLDLRVLAYSGTLALLSAVLFGLLPALRATRTDVALTLRANSRSVTGGPLGSGRGWGIGKLLVAGQVALSVVLLLGTALLLRTLSQLEQTDPGLARDRMLQVTIDAGPTGATNDQIVDVYYGLLDKIRRYPGVIAASASENGIFSGTESTTTLSVEGFQAKAESDTVANFDRVAPGYVEAIHARLLQGRDFDERDRKNSTPVAIVNSTMASFYFGQGPAIGRYITADSIRFQVVGVIADVIDHDLRAERGRRFYIPMSQYRNPPLQITFAIRTAGDPAARAAHSSCHHCGKRQRRGAEPSATHRADPQIDYRGPSAGPHHHAVRWRSAAAVGAWAVWPDELPDDAPAQRIRAAFRPGRAAK